MTAASPFIAITMGCPVGIGPEIVLKFFAGFQAKGEFQPIVLGDLGVLGRVAETLGLAAKLVPWRPGEPVRAGTVPVLECSRLDATALAWGRPSAETGRAMAAYVGEAVRRIQAGELAALCTCPITKSALKLAGIDFPGHTEMLAKLSGTNRYAMMMAGPSLRVVLATIHEALARVPTLLRPEALTDRIDLTRASLQRDFGLASPRIGVAGLNPHAGEQGMFGREEIEIIAPVVEQCRARGWEVSGPLPPDTVFLQAAGGRFDAVVAMYHDQGLIPFKLLHFKDGVNVTLGLPIVRTSVDHGTGYDIAGQGLADPSSLAAAWSLAAAIVTNRRASQAVGH